MLGSRATMEKVLTSLAGLCMAQVTNGPVLQWGVPFRIKVSLWLLGLLLAAVVLGPLLLPIPPMAGLQEARSLAWPGSSWVPVEGVGLHVEAMAGGSAVLEPAGGAASEGGPTYLLLHGFGSNSRTWRHVLPWLSEDALAVAYDRPAFGLSDRPMGRWPLERNPYAAVNQARLAAGLLDAIGMDEVVLIAHSAGAELALELALTHPDRVRALVLVAPAVDVRGGAPAWSQPLLRTPQMERLGPYLMRQLAQQPGIDLLRSSWYDPSRIDAEVLDVVQRPMRVLDWDRALWEQVKASRAPLLGDRIAAVRQPLLLLTGAQDTVVPPEVTMALGGRLSGVSGGAEFLSLEGCGHLPQEECPDAFRLAVETFLARQAGVATGLLPPASAPMVD